MWDMAALEKRLGRDAASLAVLTDLAAGPNPHRLRAFEAQAKHYEHREVARVKAARLPLSTGGLEIPPPPDE